MPAQEDCTQSTVGISCNTSPIIVGLPKTTVSLVYSCSAMSADGQDLTGTGVSS